jgi:undecaprenyl-diphosphatase
MKQPRLILVLTDGLRPEASDALGRPLALVPLPDPFSFPSGHAAATTAVLATLIMAHPGTAPLALPIAGLVSYSRIALRVHHASDVLAGNALGLAGALAAEAFTAPLSALWAVY